MARPLATLLLALCCVGHAAAQAQTATPQAFPTCTRAQLQATTITTITKR